MGCYNYALETEEAITMAFKHYFSCSNNAMEYEAYVFGLVIAREMGIKHLKNIEDSNLVICQRLEFSLEELSLAQIRTLIQRLEEKFKTFEINHAQRIEEPLCGCSYNLGFSSHQSTKEMYPSLFFWENILRTVIRSRKLENTIKG